MKNFVKAMNRKGQAFNYLREKFRNLSDTKVREDIFVGPQLHQLFKPKNTIHSVLKYVDFFPAICGVISDEHGERFHRDIFLMQCSYAGHCNEAMLANYCWLTCGVAPEITYKRKAIR